MAQAKIAARCHGVDVPVSPFLNETRTARIAAERYERQEIAGALDVVGPEDIVLEMGAGLGIVGAVTAKNAKPKKVFSFEANPDLLPHIEALYRQNRLQSKIELKNAVLLSGPDQPETITFHRHNSFLGSSTVARPGRRSRAVDVPTRDFDSVLQETGATVLLIDIEGGELALLEHANLRGLRAIVIEFHPGVYGQQGMKRCKSLLRRAGFRRLDETSSRLVWTCTRAAGVESEDDTGHAAPSPTRGWSTQLRTEPEATIVPPDARSFVQNCGIFDQNGQFVPQGALWRNNRVLTTAPESVADAQDRLTGTWIWGGVLFKNFAHFVAESTGRLWALDHVDLDNIAGLVFAPRSPGEGDQIRALHREFVSLLGVDLPIHVASAPTSVERLIVPGQGFGLGKIVHGTPQFRHTFQERFGQAVAPDGPERLYISRSKLGVNRGAYLGEAHVEAYLASQGYEIFHPQDHDLTTQIARYKAAKQIIGAEGSALHLLAYVARPDQRIAMILRRRSPATAMIEQHIEAFSGYAPLTLDTLKQVWAPAQSQRKRLYAAELDMKRLQSSLVQAGFIDGGSPWEDLAAHDVPDHVRQNYRIEKAA